MHLDHRLLSGVCKAVIGTMHEKVVENLMRRDEKMGKYLSVSMIL